MSMAWIAVGSAVVGLYAAKKQAGAIEAGAERGAEATTEASRENNEFQREVFEQQREDTAPWREAGAQALTSLQEGIAAGEFDPSQFKFEADPGYQFRLSEGIKARDRSAAARGRLLSGAQQKAITRYGEDVASEEYGRAYQRNVLEKQQKYNVLAGMAGIGQMATSQDIAARNVMAGRVGESITGTGRAVARGAEVAGSARASAYGGGAQAVQQGAQNYLLYQMMQ